MVVSRDPERSVLSAREHRKRAKPPFAGQPGLNIDMAEGRGPSSIQGAFWMKKIPAGTVRVLEGRGEPLAVPHSPQRREAAVSSAHRAIPITALALYPAATLPVKLGVCCATCAALLSAKILSLAMLTRAKLETLDVYRLDPL